MAQEYILPLEQLIEQFERLPGIGHKTAVRLAFSVLDGTEENAEAFSEAILNAKHNVHQCRICQNLTDADICSICADTSRDKTTICVVEDARTVLALERVREYHGLYHVLGGTLSPMDGIGPDQLNIQELIARLGTNEVKEIILATNPNIEGETTAMYLSKLLRPLGVKVSRLAYGVPVGSDLDYADEVTLFRAMEGRKEL